MNKFFHTYDFKSFEKVLLNLAGRYWLIPTNSCSKVTSESTSSDPRNNNKHALQVTFHKNTKNASLYAGHPFKDLYQVDVSQWIISHDVRL